VFAYGSLLWDAQVCDAAAEPALLRGYHRSFCLYSYDYRGTPANPGLTLGLDRGGSCRGAALRLPAALD
jgi:cation transport protein ChaC